MSIRNGTKWGDWRLDADGGFATLELESKHGKYRIHLDEITDSAKMLDWIFQLRQKTWVTNDIMGDLLSAFEDIFDPQGTLCGSGMSRTLDTKAHLKRTIAP